MNCFSFMSWPMDVEVVVEQYLASWGNSSEDPTSLSQAPRFQNSGATQVSISKQSYIYIWVIFPRTGKMSKICLNFFLKLHCDKTVWFFKVFSTVLKRLCPLESQNTFVYPSKIFGVPCSTPVFALLSDFWVKIRALVRPNRQRWTGFDLLIISGVKFWWFSFFLEPL